MFRYGPVGVISHKAQPEKNLIPVWVQDCIKMPNPNLNQYSWINKIITFDIQLCNYRLKERLLFELFYLI